MEFDDYNHLIMANILEVNVRLDMQHTESNIIILIKLSPGAAINKAKTNIFAGADISDLDLANLNSFIVRLKMIVKPKNIKFKFNVEVLKDPNIFYQATMRNLPPFLTL